LDEGLRQLIALQKLDDELSTATTERGALPGRREELASRREAVETEQARSKEALQEAETAQRRAETDVQDQQALLQRLEGQQFQVKSNDAYTALLREIDHAREAVSDAETRVLEAMENIDAAKERSAEAERQAEATLTGVAEQERELDTREKLLDERLGELGEQHVGVRAGFDSELLNRYDRVPRRPALAGVRGEMCLGCRVHIPPQQKIELMRGDGLISCSRCHRILIPEASLDTAK